MDTVSGQRRSQIMAAVRAKNTRPELAVRRLVYRLGYRYRLHRRDLPGSPDLVFASLRKVLFVHGCFWHRHPGCPKTRTPKTRAEYWVPKLKRNVERDRRNRKELRASQWGVLVVWECQLRDERRLAKKVAEFLGEHGKAPVGR